MYVFCLTYGFKQLIKGPTRSTCSTSTLIDHILTNTQEYISQSGIIDTAVSGYSIVYCTRKISRANILSFVISKFFQNFYSNLPCSLVEKFPAAVNKFGINFVEVYYKDVLHLLENKFTFQTIKLSSVLKLLKNFEVNKASSLDYIWKFYKRLCRYIGHPSNSDLKFIY